MSRWTSFRITEYGLPLEQQIEETPEPRGTEVLLRVTGCGVCHSDLHTWEGFFDMGGGRRTQAGGTNLPLTPGHEIAGEVVAFGPDAQGVKVGDHRLVYPWIGCGLPACQECRRGDEPMCGKRALGVFQNGGFSDHVLVPHPKYLLDYGGLPPVLAATFACSGLTAYAALKKVGKLGPEDRALIIGAGGVGVSAVRLARLVTGHAPIVADIDPDKRAAALEQGAAETFNPSVPGGAKEFVKATGGVAAAIDFVGAESTVKFGTGALRKGGKLVVVGLFGGLLQMPIPLFPLLEVTIQGSKVGTLAELKELIALAQAGRFGPIPHTTRPLCQASQTLADLKNGKILGRVVLTP
ncbi:MAG TPA: alcohol dehydrogenase [Bryobacteraceae bacterium]|nr:alcohol dehydrogenase [Bryobacteraceae bacterium]